ncbi:MAG: hypothetical protein EOR12_20925 [Mesorhizobium sp.]|uniref:hypothetical protein n=1 Tax=Mesorhizobium sp. TaxID=1871066 RepID=UPI000FE7DF9A|nr:hypothetical protein [Mesorhizobium sp.]RWP87142.1 MAG: hypothetical protein EOR12_20925 [Mesorhizobium sp.]TIN67945.1 MAG: hypothetical protein E5Y30_25700 [Mesorhizobium sp.]TIN89361.1 MAG: hypothetical protein E5Y29_01670 [Mesorhizobium sp.]
MAIKFSSKDQTAASGAAAKPAKPVAAKAGDATEAATDLFKSPADSPKGKTAKKK